MTAKEYLKQAYLLDKQIQVEVKELEQLREMRGTIQGCSYGEKIGSIAILLISANTTCTKPPSAIICAYSF